jgi:putative FmdB family regulatory protein
MPVYVFTCTDCGRFELQRPMVQAGDEALCPRCGDQARRVYTPPSLPTLSAPLRGALTAEEASADAPRVVSQKRGRPLPVTHSPTPPWVLH